MTNPTSNFGWQMPTPTDLVTDLPADFEVFGQAVDTSMADLRGGTTGQILSKTTNADMDFTWIANDQGDITAVNVTAPITGGGSSGAVTIGVSAASTAAAGVVQLSDSTSTTSSVLASTPTATKSAYDLADTANTAAGAAQTTANAAVPKSTVTTAGDVIYATGSSAVTRLGIGTAGQVLTVNGGATAPAWTTISSAPSFVGCVAFNDGGNITITANTDSIVAMPSELVDTDGYHSTATNTSRITIPSGKAGKYRIDTQIKVNAGIPGYMIIRVKKNGTNVSISGYQNSEVSRTNANGSNTVVINGGIILDLAVSDYIETSIQTDLSTATYQVWSQFSAQYLGA